MPYSNRKGNKGEQEVETLLNKHGITAFRKGGAGREDLVFAHPLLDFGKAEIKKQAGVPSFVYDHLHQCGANSLFMQKSVANERHKWLWAWEAEELAAHFEFLFGRIAELEARLQGDAVLRQLDHHERRIAALEEDVRGRHGGLALKT